MIGIVLWGQRARSSKLNRLVGNRLTLAQGNCRDGLGSCSQTRDYGVRMSPIPTTNVVAATKAAPK